MSSEHNVNKQSHGRPAPDVAIVSQLVDFALSPLLPNALV